MNIAHIVTLGGGLKFKSLFSANEELTSPKSYYTTALNPADSTDTLWYTFKATTLMARACFDPKRIFFRDDLRIFGEEDLKIYGELAILGLKDYPQNDYNRWGYDTLTYKMPMMLGINLPVFTILDVLNFEIEYFQLPSPNGYQRVQVDWMPVPDQISEPRRGDDVKWSVYTKKTFRSGIFLAGQIARDHVRMEGIGQDNIDRDEALRTTSDWHWMVKAGCAF